MSAARAYLTALGLDELITRERAGKVELHCPSPAHTDRRPSAVTFERELVTACFGCGRKWSPYELALERGLSRREALELCIRFGVREERRPDAPHAARRARTPPRASRPTRLPGPPRVLPPAAAERLEAELSASVQTRRDVDRLLEELRGFDARLLERLGCGFGRADRLTGFSRPAAGAAPRLLVPVRDLSGRLVSVAALDPRPADERPPGLRKVAVPAHVDRFPLLVRTIEPVSDLLLVVEGEADALAAGSTGLAAIGLPGHAGAGGHVEAIATFARSLEASAVALVPDGDEAGRRSFVELAGAIAAAGLRVRYRPVMEQGRDLGDLVLDELRPAFPASPAERRDAGRRIASTLDLDEYRR